MAQTQSPTTARPRVFPVAGRQPCDTKQTSAYGDLCGAALGAAYAAIAEGEALIRQTREQLHLPERSGFGPLTLAWLERQRPPPKPPKPEPEYDGGETYYLADREIPVVRAAVAMLALARGTKRAGLRKAAYAELGRQLAVLRRGRDKSHFTDLVKAECGLSVRRAYEFMAMASGGKQIEKLRFETKVRVRKARANKDMGGNDGIQRGARRRKIAA